MRPLHRSTLAASALALSLVVGACSSSPSSSSSSTSSSGGGPTTTSTATGGGSGTTTSSTAGPGADGKPLARYADYRTKSYDTPSHWVCRPDTPDDICHGDLDATVIEADGSTKVEHFERAADAPVDCFYVYPTISRDPGAYSDWDASPDEEGFVTLNQAARLAATCRVFAPVYRQGTLGGLASRIGGGASDRDAQLNQPYEDVLDAFRTYMAEDNGGRGFVLIGHSQGTAMLSQLIAKEIDPNADVRSHLVGAYLAGGSVSVPKGKVVGGDFQHVPLCTKAGEAGCVVTWATFRSTSPPPADALFGRPWTGAGGTGGEAGCVNPAAVGSRSSADLDAYFPADAGASILGALGVSTEGKAWLASGSDEITTPYVRLPGLVSGRCASKDGFNWLEATVHASSGPRADDIPGDLTPQWGLHLVDVNLVMGDLVGDITAQAKAYGG
jgi:hypothetical protein